MLNISVEKLQEMFEKHIDLLKIIDSDVICGMARQSAEWLRIFGVDLSYERIAPMISGDAPVKVFDDDDLPEVPWYTERWYDVDLEDALFSEDVEITQENVALLKVECMNMFENLDLSDRNEMICSKVRELFC